MGRGWNFRNLIIFGSLSPWNRLLILAPLTQVICYHPFVLPLLFAHVRQFWWRAVVGSMRDLTTLLPSRHDSLLLLLLLVSKQVIQVLFFNDLLLLLKSVINLSTDGVLLRIKNEVWLREWPCHSTDVSYALSILFSVNISLKKLVLELNQQLHLLCVGVLLLWLEINFIWVL